MSVRTHEVHAAVVHAPLTLLPLAALIDVGAAARPHRTSLQSMGRKMWVAATAGAAFAGVAGLAASQEVYYRERTARDMTFVHGLGNTLLLAATFAMGAWRRHHPATARSAGLGLLITTASWYTAYLGGEMVYHHRVGVEGMDRPESLRRSPSLLSAEAPLKMARDVVQGLKWLVARTAALRHEPVSAASMGVDRELPPPVPPRSAQELEDQLAWRG